MYTLRRSSKFRRKLKKHLKRNDRLDKKLSLILGQLKQDPMYPSLKSHKVTNRHGNKVFSSYVTGDLRIIWNYAEAEINVLDLLDLGGHEGGGKVYR